MEKKDEITMHSNRLNYSMVLDMYQEEIEKVDIRKIADQVIARRDSRKEQYGLLQIFSIPVLCWIVSKTPTSTSVKPKRKFF